jgi:hypothetical protein
MAEKYAKWPKNIPNGRKISQTVIKYNRIFHSKALQIIPKLGDFWFENKPSGNPGCGTHHVAMCVILRFMTLWEMPPIGNFREIQSVSTFVRFLQLI